MVKKLNPSFVEYFAGYLKKLLTDKKNGGTITAQLFQDAVTNAANVYLRDNYGLDAAGVRAVLAQSTPELECAKAIKARRQLGMLEPEPRISLYKTQTEIGKVDPAIAKQALADARLKYSAPDNNGLHKLIVDNWTSKTNMLLPDPTQGGKKRQMAVDFDPTSAVNCGECWICKTDVMSYSGKSKQLYNDYDIQDDNGTERIDGTTPCGDCEHVSAIMASYIAGMLTSAGASFAEGYWASYYVACVDCNRRKSNYIGVRLNVTRGWEVDADGVDAIVDAIFPEGGVDQHVSEYNPIRHALTKKYNEMPDDAKIYFRKFVRENIEAGTETWCEAANDSMFNTGKIKAKNIKMSFNLSKIIEALNRHLNVITSALEKKAKSKAFKRAREEAPSVNPHKKKRGGGGDSDGDGEDTMEESESDDEGEIDTERIDGAPMTGEGAPAAEGEVVPMLERDGAATPPADTHIDMAIDTHDTDYTLRWYDLTGEPRIDDEYEYDCDEEEEEEEDARILNHRNVIVEHISKTYGQILFTHYERDYDGTFEELITNLSNSMHETLKALNPHIKPLSDENLNNLVTDFYNSRSSAFTTPQKTNTTNLLTRIVTDPRRPGFVPTGSALFAPTGSALFAPIGSESQPSQYSQAHDNPLIATVSDPYAAKFDKEVTIFTQASTKSMPESTKSRPESTTKSRPESTKSRPGSTTKSRPESTTIPDDDKDTGKRPAEPPKTFKEEMPGARPESRTGSRPSSVVGKGGGPPEKGGRLNKGHSKNKSQTHNQKNRTKRISYIKHKQTRKNQHSRKTK